MPIVENYEGFNAKEVTGEEREKERIINKINQTIKRKEDEDKVRDPRTTLQQI